MRWLDCITDSMDVSLSELRESDGQGSLACCNSCSHKDLDKTERLNNNPRTQEYVNFPRKGDFANVIKVKDTEMGR